MFRRSAMSSSCVSLRPPDVFGFGNISKGGMTRDQPYLGDMSNPFLEQNNKQNHD
jgi:hypothetical protein